jgi:hypothetical protein
MRYVLLVLAGAILLSLCGLAAAAEPVSRTRMDKQESGCRSGCLRHSGDYKYCKAYCQCVRRELFTGRSSQEVDALYAVMHPKAPDSPAKKVLEDLMNGCIVEADKQ